MIPLQLIMTRFAFKDKKSGYDLIAFWDGSDLPENTCELGSAVVKVENLKMDTPVWVDMLTSRIYEIPAANISKQGSVTIIKDVPYLDSPIALTDLSVLTYVEARKSKGAAEWLRENEIHAFVLSGEKNSLKDAVKYLKSMSMAWSVDPKQIGVLGASSLTKSYKEAGANFVVNIDQPANADKKNTLFAVDANNDKFDLKALWLKDLLKWIEPRKTKVF
jgi:hypothetical protein